MFSGFGPFGRNPIGGHGLPQDTSSLPQTNSAPGSSINQPVGEGFSYNLVGAQESADSKNEGKTGLNITAFDPTGYDESKGFVSGAKLCGHDQIFGPYKQTRFLGASVTSFSSSLGFNNGSSSLNVTLVEDICKGGKRTWYTTHRTTTLDGYADTDNLLIYNRADLIEKNDVDKDEFAPPEVGTPVYFRVGSFEYCGILQSWQRLESSAGVPTYSVRVTDPRDILDGVQVILDQERSEFIAQNDESTDNPENLWNLWNVYDLLEDTGKSCNPYDRTPSYRGDELCVGGSKRNQRGIEWNLIKEALKIYGAGIEHIPADGYQADLRNNHFAIRHKDARYFLDIEELPEISDLRFNGPVTSLLDLISQVCEASSRDFWVELLPVVWDDPYSYGSADQEQADFVVRSLPPATFVAPGQGIALFIKIRTISRNQQPKTDAIKAFLHTYKGSGLVIDSARGLESINEPTNIALLGGPKRDMYQCEEPFVAADSSFLGIGQVAGSLTGEVEDIEAAVVVEKDGNAFNLTYDGALELYDDLKDDVFYIGVGAAQKAFDSDIYPEGIQPFWGFHENSDLIIGANIPNPFRADEVIDEEGNKTLIGDVNQDKLVARFNPEEVYAIKVSVNNLIPKLFSGELIRRDISMTGGETGDQFTRSFGASVGRLTTYTITTLEMRAAKAGFEEWRHLVSSDIFHPVTMTYQLQGLTGIAQQALQVLTKVAEGGLNRAGTNKSLAMLAPAIQKSFKKDGRPTGLVDSVFDTPALAEQKRRQDLDLRTIHEFVLSFANRAGRQFLVPLTSNPIYENKVVNWRDRLSTKSTQDPYYGTTDGSSVGNVILTAVAGKGYGHFSAGLCSYTDEQTNRNYPTLKIVDRAPVSSQPSKGDDEPFKDRRLDTLNNDDSVLMLPHPIATSYFQDDLGLLEGFCRIATHKYVSGAGETRIAKIDNINEGDLFYNKNLYSAGTTVQNSYGTFIESTGAWIKADYAINSPQADTENNIAYISHTYKLGPYAVATLPSPLSRVTDATSVPIGELLSLLLIVLSTTQNPTTEGKKITFDENVIKRIRDLLATVSQGSMSIAEEFLFPEAFAVPIESNILRFGPFLSEPTGIAGITKVFDESSDLVPWNYGTIDIMNQAASGLAFSRKTTAEFAEIGSLRIPGLPSGSTLGFEVEHIGNARGALAADQTADGLALPARHLSQNIASGLPDNNACFDGEVVYHHVATGDVLSIGEYPILDGSKGPQISDISVSLSVDGGVTTNYQFRTFTKKNSEQLTKVNLDKIRREGQEALKDRISQIKDVLNNSFAGGGGAGGGFGGFSAFVTSPNKFDNAEPNTQSKSQADKTKDESVNQASSPDVITGISNKIPLLIKPDERDSGEHLSADSGNITRAATINSRDIAIEANNQDKSKVFMSMDGLLRPVSVNGDSEYPQFYKSIQNHCGEGTSENSDDYFAEQEWYRITGASASTENGFDGTTTYYSQRPHPPIVGSGVNPAASEGNTSSCDVQSPYDADSVIIPTGIYSADYQININYLNPFTNSNGHKNVHPDDTESMYLGHDIQLLSSNENQELRTRTELENAQLDNKGSIDLAYQGDYRGMALRGPLLIQGWGYDLEGKPIPNYKDWYDDNTLETAKKGQFARDNLTDYFAPGWLKKSDAWPVAPVDLRFDRDRGVWVAPQPFKFVKVRLKEAIPNDCYTDGAPAIIEDMDGKKIYDDKGVEINEARRRIFVKADLGTSHKKDSLARAYYDEQACEYRLFQGSQDSSAPALGMAILKEDLLIPEECPKTETTTTSPGEDEDEAAAASSSSSSGSSSCSNTAKAIKIFVDGNGCEYIIHARTGQQNLDGLGKIGNFEAHPDTIIDVVNTLNQPIEAGTKVIISNNFEKATFAEAESPGENGSVSITNSDTEYYRVLQAEFCPLVVITSIYIREDYPCILNAVYDNYFFYPTSEGICGTKGATAGGNVEICNRYAETQIALGINFCPSPPPVSCYVPADCADVKIPCCGEIIPPDPPPPSTECGHCYYVDTDIWCNLYDNFPPFSGKYHGVCWDESVVLLDEYGYPLEPCRTNRDYKLLKGACKNGGECVSESFVDPNLCEPYQNLTPEELGILWNYMAAHCPDWNDPEVNELTPADLAGYLCKIPCNCDPPTEPPGDCDDAGECLFITESFVLDVEGAYGCHISGCVETMVSSGEDNYFLVEGGCKNNDPDSCTVPDGTNCKEPTGSDINDAIDWLEQHCCEQMDTDPCDCPNNSALDLSNWPGGQSAFIEELKQNLCVTECECDDVYPPPDEPYIPNPEPEPPSPSPTPTPNPSFANYLYATAATDFCFDIDIKVEYPTYPELKIDVGERVIYLQSMWSKPMGSYDRQAFDLDVNSMSPNVDAEVPNMPTFNSRKTSHWWQYKPNESPMQDMITSYAAQELNGQHGKDNLEAPNLNISDFKGFERVKNAGETCCESYAEDRPEPLHPIGEVGKGDKTCIDDPNSSS
jgi:hypothetical protein